jgi:hypothetical protein
MIRSRAALIVSVVALAVTVAGCTSEPEPSASRTSGGFTASPSTATPEETEVPDAELTPEPNSEAYSDADALKKAVVDAGVDCSSWVTPAAAADASATSSGQCGDDLTISVFADGAARDAVVSDRLKDADSTVKFLVGANWLISVPDGNSARALDKLLPALGGFISPEGS